MNDYEMERYCERCTNPNCYKCQVMGAWIDTELGLDEVDHSEDFDDDEYEN